MHLKYVYSLHIDIIEMATKSDFFSFSEYLLSTHIFQTLETDKVNVFMKPHLSGRNKINK